MTTAELKRRLEATRAAFRYDHALGTADTARRLAERFGEDPDKAYLAGLLHDCAKGFDDDPAPILALAEEAGIVPNALQAIDAFEMLHAAACAYAARRDYGVEDEDVLQAIARHLDGHPQMTRLDKIVFIADRIEPNRRWEGVEEMRLLAQGDLEEAFFRLVLRDIHVCTRNGFPIDRPLIDTYNALVIDRRGGVP